MLSSGGGGAGGHAAPLALDPDFEFFRQTSGDEPSLGAAAGGGAREASGGGSSSTVIPAISELRSMVTMMRNNAATTAAAAAAAVATSHTYSITPPVLDPMSNTTLPSPIVMLSPRSPNSDLLSHADSVAAMENITATSAAGSPVQLTYEIEFIHVQVWICSGDP